MTDPAPSREIDALIAETFMGLVPCQAYRCPSKPFCHANPDSPERGGETKCYSTDIAAAFEVMNTFLNHGWSSRISCSDGPDSWTLSLARLKQLHEGNHYTAYAKAATAPHAICLAALNLAWDNKSGYLWSVKIEKQLKSILGK